MNENETQNMTPKQIVDLILFEQHISKNQFAKAIGVTPTNVYDIYAGKIKTITNDMADKIRAAFPNYTKSWLLSGEGSPYINEPEMPETENGSPAAQLHSAKTTADIVKICSMFIGEIAAQREMYGGQISALIALIEKQMNK